MFNAARIWKLYGTICRKGDSTEDRPHRVAKLLEVPATIVIAPTELLKKLADLKLDEPNSQKQTNRDYRQYDSREHLDLPKWLTDHGINYKQKADWEGWHMYQPDHCIFDQTHVNSQTMFMQNDQGAIKYDCKHNSCAGKTWHDVWQTIDPHTYDFEKSGNLNIHHHHHRQATGMETPPILDLYPPNMRLTILPLTWAMPSVSSDNMVIPLDTMPSVRCG